MQLYSSSLLINKDYVWDRVYVSLPREGYNTTLTADRVNNEFLLFLFFN